jgi:hypothetical protein
MRGMEDKEGMIHLRGSEAEMEESAGELVEPGTGCLFEAIKSLLEVTNMVRKPTVNKVRGLFHEDLFFKRAMEEGVGDIKLLNNPVKVSGNGKDGSDCGRLDNQTKGFNEVNDILLLEAFGNKSSLEAIKSTIYFLLHLKHPFVGDDVFVRRPRAKFPSLIIDQGRKFFTHGLKPMRGFKGLGEPRRWGRQGLRCGGRES